MPQSNRAHAAPPRMPSRDEIATIAHAAVAHVRTVERRLLRLPVRGAVAARVDAELVARGFLAAPTEAHAVTAESGGSAAR